MQGFGIRMYEIVSRPNQNDSIQRLARMGASMKWESATTGTRVAPEACRCSATAPLRSAVSIPFIPNIGTPPMKDIWQSTVGAAHLPRLFLLITILITSLSSAWSATATKTGTGTDLTGATAGVWAGGSGPNGSPTSDDIATWTSASVGAGLTLDTDSAWGGINVSGALTAIDIIGAGKVTLGAGGIDMGLSTVNLSLANPIALGASQLWKAALGRTLTVSGTVSGTAGLTLGAVPVLQSVTNETFLTTTAQNLFPGVTLAAVVGTGGKMGGAWVNAGTPLDGTGYLLSNSVTTATYWLEALDGGYTKGVKIQLDQVGNDVTAKSLSTKYVSGSSLGYNFNTGGTAGTLAQSQTGNGYGGNTTILTYAVGGTGIGNITLAGTNTYSGGTTLVAGKLNLNNGGSSSANSAIGTGALTLNGGTLDNTSSAEVTLLPNNAQNWNGDFAYAGSVTNLNLGTGAVTLNASRTVTVSAKKLTVGGSISGTGCSLTKAGAGTLALTGANTYSGGTFVNAGQLQVGAGGASGDLSTGNVTVGSIGSVGTPALLFNRNDSPTFNNTFVTAGGGNGYWGAAAGTQVTLAGPVLATNGFVWFCGPGTFTLANTTGNDFSGGIVVNGSAVVEFPSASVFNNIGIKLYFGAANGGGTLRYTSATNETLALNPTWGLAAGTSNIFDVANPAAALTISSTMLNNGGTSGITKVGAGTLILTAASTYTGSTAVDAGTLQVDGSIGGTAVTVNSGATLAGVGTVGGAVTVKSNALLTGTGTISGATTIEAGGRLAPGTTNIGTLTCYGAVTTLTGGTNSFRIDKTLSVLTCDQVQSSSSMTYGGTLEVTATGEALVNGDSFTLFPYASSYHSTFATFDLPALPAGLSWDKSFLATDGSIRVVNTVGTPIFTPLAGGYASVLPVTITADAGSTIYYTTDGSDPVSNPNNSRLSGSSPISGIVIPLDTNVTILAFATKTGYGDSPVASASYQTLSVPTWITPFSGSWAVPAYWSNNVVANGSSVPADFSTQSLYPGGDVTVTLDSSWTIGSLLVGDRATNANWFFEPGTGGSLAFAGTSPSPITVINQAATIGVPISCASTLIKAGAGTLTLTTNNLISGGVTVNAGTLILAQAAANNWGTSNSVVGPGTFTINSGAVVQKGAHFQVCGLNNTNNASHVVINGGTFEFGAYQEYLRTIDLTGGTINGTNGPDHILIRAPADLTINSFASSTTSTIDGFGLGKIDLTYGNLLLDVADGPAATDLLITTHISENTGAGSGSKSLTKTGAGTLVLAGTNTYTGPTAIQGGTLRVDGSLSTNTVTVNAGAVLGGTGSIGGTVVLNGTISPGASVGTLASGSQVWNGGGAYRFELYSAATSAAWDLLAITGTLDLQANAGNKFVIRLASMADATTPGLLPDFDGGAAYHWPLATASGGILNFDPAAFSIDLSAFSNAYTGTFSLDVQDNSLVLSYGTGTVLTPPAVSGYGPLSGSSFPLTFSGPNGQSYKVYFSTNVSLPLSSWTVLTSGTFGSTPVTYMDNNATNSHGFYRVGSP